MVWYEADTVDVEFSCQCVQIVVYTRVPVAEWSFVHSLCSVCKVQCVSVYAKFSFCADCSVHQGSPVPASSPPHASSAHRKRTAVQGNTIELAPEEHYN